jgi:AcrR family transcriptional regulator
VARLPQHLAKAPVGRQRLSREELGRHQRRRIIEVATAVFAKRGYPPSTVENIADAAGIAVGSFYVHFANKEDCLLAAYDLVVGEARDLLTAAVRAQSGWPRQTLAALHELLVLIAAEPLKARLALVEIQTGGPVALARYGETLDLVIGSLAGGRKVAAVDPPPPETQEAATANGLAWLLAQRILHGEAKDVEELFGQMAEVVLEPYLGGARTRRELAAFQKNLISAQA